MTISISVPGPAGSCNIQLDPGEILYLLGANGTGKSALLHRINVDHGTKSRWIPPHRRSWLQSSGSNLTAANKEQRETNLQNVTFQPNARWIDHNAEDRVNRAIFDLIQKRTQQNQELADAFRAGDQARGQELLERDEDPFVTLSGLLTNANLPFDFSVDRNATIVATKSGIGPYSAAEMSDGERNAEEGQRAAPARRPACSGRECSFGVADIIHPAAGGDDGVGVEAAVSPHRELSPGPGVAHPPHRRGGTDGTSRHINPDRRARAASA